MPKLLLKFLPGLVGLGLLFSTKTNVSTAPLAAIISGVQRIHDLLNVGCYRQAHMTVVKAETGGLGFSELH